MPYVNIRIIKGATQAQKEELIAGTTELLQRVLNKNPASTFVVIDEIEAGDWGAGGISVAERNKRAGEGG